MLPQESPYGNSTALCYGIYATNLLRRSDFVTFIVSQGYADSISRANQIWTQSREYYVGDTGTVTARPHRDPCNNYAAYLIRQNYGEYPLFTSIVDLEDWNSRIRPNYLSRRPSSGSLSVEDPARYLQEGGLLGLGGIVAEGEFAFAYVLQDS